MVSAETPRQPGISPSQWCACFPVVGTSPALAPAANPRVTCCTDAHFEAAGSWAGFQAIVRTARLCPGHDASGGKAGGDCCCVFCAHGLHFVSSASIRLSVLYIYRYPGVRCSTRPESFNIAPPPVPASLTGLDTAKTQATCTSHSIHVTYLTLCRSPLLSRMFSRAGVPQCCCQLHAFSGPLSIGLGTLLLDSSLLRPL